MKGAMYEKEPTTQSKDDLRNITAPTEVPRRRHSEGNIAETNIED